jgi:hypothetical protein
MQLNIEIFNLALYFSAGNKEVKWATGRLTFAMETGYHVERKAFSAVGLSRGKSLEINCYVDKY